MLLVEPPFHLDKVLGWANTHTHTFAYVMYVCVCLVMDDNVSVLIGRSATEHNSNGRVWADWAYPISRDNM